MCMCICVYMNTKNSKRRTSFKPSLNKNILDISMIWELCDYLKIHLFGKLDTNYGRKTSILHDLYFFV